MACVCDILSIFYGRLECIAHSLDYVAVIAMKLVSTCMLVQTHLEVTSSPRPIDWTRANAYPRGASRAAARMRDSAAQESLQAVLVPKQFRMDD